MSIWDFNARVARTKYELSSNELYTILTDIARTSMRRRYMFTDIYHQENIRKLEEMEYKVEETRGFPSLLWAHKISW